MAEMSRTRTAVFRLLVGAAAVLVVSAVVMALLGTGSGALRWPWAGNNQMGPSQLSATPTGPRVPPGDVQVSGTLGPDYRADALGRPVNGMAGVDTSSISPGGGLGPDGHDWRSMGPGQLMVPQANLVIPVVDRGIVTDGSGGRSMDLPVSFQAGWLRESAGITAAAGTTVVAGHVNWSDGSWAPMSNLYNASAGMEVYLTDRSGKLTSWRVTDRTEIPQSELADRVALTDTSGPRRLVLITCKGRQNADGSITFTDNWAVTAEPL